MSTYDPSFDSSDSTSSPFDHLVAQLSEYLDPYIVAGFMDEIRQMHAEGRSRIYVVMMLTEWVSAVLNPDDMLGGARDR